MTEERVVMASRFKAQCLALIDRVAIDHVPVVITKRGRPVARLVAIEDEPAPRDTQGSVHLIAEDDEDYFSTGEVWDTER
jgi:prevent-host-death family protein